MELHVLSIAVHLSVGGFPVLIYDKLLEEMGVNFVLAGYVCDYAKLIGAWFGEPVSGTVECSTARNIAMPRTARRVAFAKRQSGSKGRTSLVAVRIAR